MERLDAVPDLPRAAALALPDFARGLARAAVGRARDAAPAARARDGADVVAAAEPRPDGIAELTPRPAPRATPVTARPAVSTPATPKTTPRRIASRTRGENNAAVAAAARATSDSKKSSAAIDPPLLISLQTHRTYLNHPLPFARRHQNLHWSQAITAASLQAGARSTLCIVAEPKSTERSRFPDTEMKVAAAAVTAAISPPLGLAVAAGSALSSPRVRETLRKGTVHALAGAMKLGDQLTAAAAERGHASASEPSLASDPAPNGQSSGKPKS